MSTQCAHFPAIEPTADAARNARLPFAATTAEKPSGIRRSVFQFGAPCAASRKRCCAWNTARPANTVPTRSPRCSLIASSLLSPPYRTPPNPAVRAAPRRAPQRRERRNRARLGPRRAGLGDGTPPAASSPAPPHSPRLRAAHGRAGSGGSARCCSVLPDAAARVPRRCQDTGLRGGANGGAAPPPTAPPCGRHGAASRFWQPFLAAGGCPRLGSPRKALLSSAPSPGAALSPSKPTLQIRPDQRSFQVVAGRR